MQGMSLKLDRINTAGASQFEPRLIKHIGQVICASRVGGRISHD